MQYPVQPENTELEARYSNTFRIGYNAYELILDFGQCHSPGKEHMHTRIVTSPATARNLSDLLQSSLDQREQKFGPEEVGE
jgi:hypothetical protein